VQRKLPHQNIVAKENSYLGLLELSLGFDNISARPDHRDPVAGCGVDHVAVAEGLACKAIRMKATRQGHEGVRPPPQLIEEHQVPAMFEFILERVANISMWTEIDAVKEFEEIP